FFTHSFSVCAEQPILAAIEDTAAHRDGCSPSCSATIRTARARTSGENLFVVLLVIDPTSHELGSPANPARFKDRVHRCLHIIVDATRARPSKESKRSVMRIEDHLLALARIGSHEEHPAMAKPHVGDLHRDCHPVKKYELVTPTKLVGFAWRKAQRNLRFG